MSTVEGHGVAELFYTSKPDSLTEDANYCNHRNRKATSPKRAVMV